MKFAYGLITALTVVSSALATEDHAEHHAPEPHQDSHEHPAWLSHLRVGTTMHKGNFVSEENPLHKRNLKPHHELHDHHGHDATEIFLEHEHYHHDHHSYNVHSHPSCKALQTSTEHDAAVIEHLLQSARSIAKGMEEVHKHLSEASEDEHHRHHSLWSEHIKTPCEVLEESTLIEMEIAEHLLEGALLVVKELKERWQHAGATVHVDEHGHDTHGHEHDNVYSAHHDAHVHPDHHDAHGHHDTHGHPEHHDTHGHPEHHDTHGHPEHHGDEHHEDHHWWDIFHHDEHYLEHDKGAHPHEIHPSDHAHHDAHHDAHHAAHHDEHGAHHDAHHNEHGDHKEHKESHGWFHWFEKHSPEDLKREHPGHH